LKSLFGWRGLAALSAVATIILVFGQPVPSLAGSKPTPPPSAGPFNKVWTFALSQFVQASQSGNSLLQLSDGTIVVGGNDAFQPNQCSTRAQPFRGGAWLVAVTPDSGQNVFQKLYSTCANAAQSIDAVSKAPDGGIILAGGDFSNPACADGCGWFAKLSSQGSILWQHDLTGADAAGAGELVTLPDGSSVTVGNETTAPAFIHQALIQKITADGSLQWSRTYSETDNSFPGAFSGGNFTFKSVQPTADGGFIASGVADAKFSSGYANVLVVMKLDASGAAQWTKAYYGTNWQSAPAGFGPYPIFTTADGFVLSGTVQASSYPFERRAFLLKLDAQGSIIWQKGYGGDNGGYNKTSEDAGAVATADGGYVLGGMSNVFQQAPNGWIMKADGAGNIVWQKSYSGLTSTAGNVFNAIIQTSDGGFAATGESWTPNPTYGGPGLWLTKIEPNGNIGTCSCAQDTNATALALDLNVFPASFAGAPSGLAFGGVGIKDKATSISPTTIFP